WFDPATAAIFLLLFLMAAGCFVFFHYYRQNRCDWNSQLSTLLDSLLLFPRMDPAFTFVRFRSHASDIELEMDPNGFSRASTLEAEPKPTSSGSSYLTSLPSIIPSVAGSIRAMVTPSSSMSSVTTALAGSLRSSGEILDTNPIFKLMQTTAT